jgi:hypothetical protein
MLEMADPCSSSNLLMRSLAQLVGRSTASAMTFVSSWVALDG